MLDDFGYNSSPVVDRCQQGDDFRLGMPMDSLRFGENDFDIPSYTNFDMDPSYNTPSRTFDDTTAQVFPQPAFVIPQVFEQHQPEKPKASSTCLTPKPNKRPLVFQPFASFEATEMTVQSLKNGLVGKPPKALPRAHSFGMIGFDL